MSAPPGPPCLAAGKRAVIAYFRGEDDRSGEEVVFAVSDGPSLDRWTPVPGSVASPLGSRGMRDPFLFRDDTRDRFVLLATDLRVWSLHDWHEAVTWGSRSILVSESVDLLSWTPPRLVPIAPPEAGNAWAPKASWSESGGCWEVFFASALYPEGDRTAAGSYQRILIARTIDFARFDPAEIYLDLGHDVIDLSVVVHGGDRYRFSVPHADRDAPSFVAVERSAAPASDAFEPVTPELGSGILRHAEGPAALSLPDRLAVLIDEFGGTGYHLFTSIDPASGIWMHEARVDLPPPVRHGSLLAVSAERAETLTAVGARITTAAASCIDIHP